MTQATPFSAKRVAATPMKRDATIPALVPASAC